MVDGCFQIAAFCITGAVIAVLLRQYCREQAMFAALAVCIAVLTGFVLIISPVISKMTEIFETAGLSSSYISLIFKAAAICFITEIICELCRDSGESAIASAAELWGRGAMVVISMPMLEAFIEIVTDFL